MNTNSYSERFLSAHEALSYDGLYAPGGLDSFVWEHEKKLLLRILERCGAGKRGLKHLDFACGTGRIISFMEPYTASSTGIDISPQMVAVAEKKVTRARLLVANLLDHPRELAGEFDVITAFRFFLNAEPELRLAILRALAGRLNGPNARLIFNIHGNTHSLRHLGVTWRRMRGEKHCEMSLRESHALAVAAGLTVEEWYGFGFSLPVLHRSPLRLFAAMTDHVAERIRPLQAFSTNLLFVCRRCDL